jgi:hypothetical protein
MVQLENFYMYTCLAIEFFASIMIFVTWNVSWQKKNEMTRNNIKGWQTKKKEGDRVRCHMIGINLTRKTESFDYKFQSTAQAWLYKLGSIHMGRWGGTVCGTISRARKICCHSGRIGWFHEQIQPRLTVGPIGRWECAASVSDMWGPRVGAHPNVVFFAEFM